MILSTLVNQVKATLNLTNAYDTDTGIYTCNATNVAGTATDQFELTVYCKYIPIISTHNYLFYSQLVLDYCSLLLVQL